MIFLRVNSSKWCISFFCRVYILNASINATFTVQTYSRFNAFCIIPIKEKRKSMVAISSQCSFVADKAVQLSQAYFFDKGTQPELRHKNCKITLLIRISDLHYEWLFWIQTFGKFQHYSTFHAHATDFFVLKF